MAKEKSIYLSERDWTFLDKLSLKLKSKKSDIVREALLLLEKKTDFDGQNYKLIKDFLIDNQKALEAFRVASDRQTDTIEQLVKIIKDVIITKQRSKK
ncbi:MAG: hypothetical protein IJK72_01415 [Mycoplasma sp.]|nr:hypothetical protein [Mycoplasma sp.]